MRVITESKLRAMAKKGIPNPYMINKSDKLTPAAADFLKDRNIRVEHSNSVHWQLPNNETDKSDLIPVGVSNRHVHLTEEDAKVLFGEDSSLTVWKELSQPGQFAAQETVTLLGPKNLIKGVRILGPERKATQVEISVTDGFQLGIHPPIRLSGSTEGTPGLTLIGPKGCVTLEQGVIVAKRHVHLSPEDAKRFNVREGDTLMVQTMGERSTIFTDIAVRISPSYQLDLHIDMDEANGAALSTGDYVKIIGKNNQFYSRGGGEGDGRTFYR
ncbi:phosphate propanoyltransferase [Bacillus piscicola]|uniref:phosphate propanoyltransferase n=1 Tax=Bacillus piscicola TaxID=1632684 RepID=UPI001F0893B1|nr:phosphate propanoyltransferase [Bacillus piscicola]